MIRLLAIRAAITTLRRAILISRRLKPRTWACLAVTQALLAAFCFQIYRQWPHGHQELQAKSATPIYLHDSAWVAEQKSGRQDFATSDRTRPKRAAAHRAITRSAYTLRTATTFSSTRHQPASAAKELHTPTLAEREELRSNLVSLSLTRQSKTFLNAVERGEAARVQLSVVRGTGMNRARVTTNSIFHTSPKQEHSSAAGAHQIVYDKNLRNLRQSVNLEAFSANSQALIPLALTASIKSEASDLDLFVYDAETPGDRFFYTQGDSIDVGEGAQFAAGAVGAHGSWIGQTSDWLRRLLPRLHPFYPQQLSAAGSTPLLDKLQKIVLLFQAIMFTIGSAFASAFGVVGFLRGKADLKLKQLQIREMEIKLENMERERERALREAAQSSIILLS